MATSRSVRKAQLDLMRSAAVEEDLDPGLIGYWFKPISDAGGDLFICRRLSDEMYCLILADIAGHDITSSYIAAEVKGLVAGLSEYLDRPAKLLEALNRKLMEMDFDHSHVCALCMAWNTSNGFIDLANAGLPHPYLLSAEGDLHEIPVDGMLLGMFEDAAFDEARFFLRHRERMLLFSDGLDAIDSSGVLRITWPALHTVTPVNHALLQMIQQLHLDEMKVEDDMILAAIEQPPPLNTSETPANSTELNLYIHSALNLVEPALEHMVRFLGTRQGFDPCFIDRMTFTVREIILNAIHHGNRGSVKQTVHIMAFADWLQRQVRVTVKDCGSGFDLPQILAEERTAHPLRDRGRGLLGAASFADSIHAENGEVHVSFAFTPFDDDSG
jgi:anti-sigma regulatory factor (Ser/Thr protein kinase)